MTGTTSTVTPSAPWVGQRRLRVEDARLVTGRGRFVESLPGAGVLEAVLVRSPLAHARILGIDADAARALPGVVAVWDAAMLGVPDQGAPGDVEETLSTPTLAREVVRYVGDPVVLVVAETLAVAFDAAERVVVDYDPLPAIADPRRAAEPDAPVLFAELGTNVVFEDAKGDPDPLAGAEVVVTGRYVNQRVAPVSMEPNAALAMPGDGRLTLWLSTRAPFRVRDVIADTLGRPRDSVRVIVPDVGGAFGAKFLCPPGFLATAKAAVELGRPVRWVETRSESMLAMNHGRGHLQEVTVGATRDGVITGLRVDVIGDCGAYPTMPGVHMPSRSYFMGCGVYRIPRVGFRQRSVVTNTTPIGPYRGAGRPEAAALVERTVDLLAAELGMDPVEVRRRNLLAPDAFPYTTPTGAVYDSGDYARALDDALALAGYDALRAEQRARRERGDDRLLGIGVSTYVEVTAGISTEYARIEVGTDGTVEAHSGSTAHGQGHETAFAQIVSGLLHVPFEAVRVVHSDTDRVAQGGGTGGSRSLQIGGSGLLRAAEEVVAKARRLVAHVLEAAEEDVELSAGGRLGVRGSPDTALDWAQVAALAQDPTRLPEGMEPGLSAALVFDQGAPSFPSGAHVAVVEVDTATGRVELVRHVAADDCGQVLNPLLVDGQMLGGMAQGVSQALYELFPYDDDGNPLTGNLASYVVPSAADLPAFEMLRPQTPSPLNPLGAKGAGESATIGATPAVQNAVVDALSHVGVRHVDMPASPERIWRLLREAGVAAAGAPPA